MTRQINEIKMSLPSLKEKAMTTNAKVGIEFELISDGVTFTNDNSEYNYTTVPQYRRMSLDSMADVRTYFVLSAFQQRRLQQDLDRWLETDRRGGISSLLSFDEYFELGQLLDLYAEDDEDLAQVHFNNGDKNKNYNLVFAELMTNDKYYEEYVDELPGESGFFHDEFNNNPKEFHEEIECGVKSEYEEDCVIDDIDSESSEPDYQEIERTLANYIEQPREWTVESDDSLGKDGVEIISPPIHISLIEDTILKMKDFSEKENFSTNSSCGLHINVSVPNFSHDTLDYLKLCLLVGDISVLEKFGRETNRYCLSSLTKISDAFNQDYSDKSSDLIYLITKHLQATLEKQTTIRLSDLTSLIPGLSNKYVSIGINDNRIEFRSVGGDWLTRDINDVLEMVYRFTYCLYAACDPEIEKKEYAKKLYKFLQQHSADKAAPMLSSLVLSGTMTTKEAISKMRAK